MPQSNEMRKLETKYTTGYSWPKRLEWLEIRGIRGWSGQRISFNFPIVAVVGENGSGKSSVLQAAACVYQAPTSKGRTWFPTEFFPETAWDKMQDVRISFGYKEGDAHIVSSIRKPTSRWLGQPSRPERAVAYIDLSRLQPVATRVGYARIAKNKHLEHSASPFDKDQVARLSEIMGRHYDNARMALSNIDVTREIPVLSKFSKNYSGFHQGSGETTVMELLRSHLPKHGLVLIDEIESSLHPRAQRRLIRDLANAARLQECQILLTTHSPYVLEELPLAARIYILESAEQKQIVDGVSPEFAMTKMDDEQHPEIELYVEDNNTKIWLSEILSRHSPELFVRCSIVPYGAANLGVALGQMVQNHRFARPTRVFLDGDQAPQPGCIVLPGFDAPERVVFNDLKSKNWINLSARIGRDISVVSDACTMAMTLGDHHAWVTAAANELMCGGNVLWQAMCSEWSAMTSGSDVAYLAEEIRDLCFTRSQKLTG